MKKNCTIRARVTENEKLKLQELATAHGLSLSEYLRRAGLSQEVIHRTEVKAVVELAKINADQARIGNLLKMAFDGDDSLGVDQLIAEIRHTQQVLKAVVSRL